MTQIAIYARAISGLAEHKTQIIAAAMSLTTIFPPYKPIQAQYQAP